VPEVEKVRRQNKRGQGLRLREDIVAAAAALLEETGSEDAITLRGLARKVGVSAPAIYGHFGDVDEILAAVVSEAFDELDTALRAAERAAEDPSEGAAEPRTAVRAVCAAYLDFARRRPQRYRVMFGRHRTHEGGAMTDRRPAGALLGAAAFDRLLGAVARTTGHPSAASRPGADTFTDATALWVALHGYASLRASVPAFPWPEDDTMLETLIGRLLDGKPSPAAGRP
jgi:AcrR family transcriptional regulator